MQSRWLWQPRRPLSWYRVLVLGEGVPGTSFAVSTPMGFYVTVYIQAHNPAEAVEKTINTVRNDSRWNTLEGVNSDLVTLQHEEITPVKAEEVPESAPGYVWFAINDTDR